MLSVWDRFVLTFNITSCNNNHLRKKGTNVTYKSIINKNEYEKDIN